MKKKLEQAEELARSRYSFGIDPSNLIDKFNSYGSILGIGVEIPSSIQNQENPSKWVNPQTLRIWKYGEEKRILTSHIFSNDRPLGQSYFRFIEWKDISDAISYIDGGLATHILFVTRWCGGYSKSTLQYYHKTSWYDKIIEIVSIDGVLFKIIGAVETEDPDDRKDLVEHVDEYHFRLREVLNRLVAKSRPVRKPLGRERKDVGWF